MVNQELLNYVKQQLQQGRKRAEIEEELLRAGWQEKAIEEAFNALGPLGHLQQPHYLQLLRRQRLVNKNSIPRQFGYSFLGLCGWHCSWQFGVEFFLVSFWV